MEPEPTGDLVAYSEALLAYLLERFPLKRRPFLVWKRSLRTSAGKAYLTTWCIGLSVPLMTSHDRVRATLLHEYAHLLAVDRHGLGAAHHGPAWKHAMRDLGEIPIRCHSYEVVRTRYVEYRCQKCGTIWTKRRRFAKGRTYLHIDCGGRLVIVRVVNTD